MFIVPGITGRVGGIVARDTGVISSFLLETVLEDIVERAACSHRHSCVEKQTELDVGTDKRQNH
jgi:hypothetical protein